MDDERFIPVDNVVIYWKLNEKGQIENLKVSFFPSADSFKDLEQHERVLIFIDTQYKNFPYSAGAVYSYWKDLSLLQKMCQLFRIILDYGVQEHHTSRIILYELGKIKEFPMFRIMFLDKYENDSVHSTEDLFEYWYNINFCDVFQVAARR